MEIMGVWGTYPAIRLTLAADFSRQSVDSFEAQEYCPRQRVLGDNTVSDIIP